MAFCFCDGSNASKNTGLTAQKPFSVKFGFFLVPIFADDGTRNKILSTDTIDAAYLTARLNDTDASKRWYPVMNLKNVTDERADPSFESFTDNSRAITSLGLRTFVGWKLSVEPKFIEKLEAFRCNRFGVYYVDACGALQGEVNADCTELYPIEVQRESFEPRLITATDAATEKVQITFDQAQPVADKDLMMIPADNITADLKEATGLIDVTASEAVAPTTTEVQLDLAADYGGFGAKIPVEGWVLADFVAFNVTDDASVTLSSVTESASVPGRYTIVYPIQTAADVLRFTSSKDGFELAAFDIAIP